MLLFDFGVKYTKHVTLFLNYWKGEYMSKPWYQSKTIWAGVIEIVIGVLGLLATFLSVGQYTPEAIVLLAVGVLTIVLRKITEVPIA
jgi:hypothetical protein